MGTVIVENGYDDDFMHISREKRDMHFLMIPFMPILYCAQIVPAKVKS
jgi:hypothetical protein